MKTISKREELKRLVKSGVSVYWKQSNYRVEYWPKHDKSESGGFDGLFTVCQSNRYATGTDSSELPDLYYTGEATA